MDEKKFGFGGVVKTTVKSVLKDSFWLMPATPNFIEDGIPYITSKNIRDNRISFENVKYISEDDFRSISSNRGIRTNDVLVSMIGTLGETAVVHESEPQFYGQNVYLLRIDEQKLNIQYYLYFMKSSYVKRFIASNNNQSTQAYLKAEHIENMLIPIVELPIQQAIVRELDSVSAIITKKKQQLAELDTLIKARFVEMFGIPTENTKGFDTKPMNDIAPTVNYTGKFDDEVWLLNLDMIEPQSGRILKYLMIDINEVGNSICTFDTSNVLYSKLRPYLNKVVIPDRCGYATSELVPLQPIQTMINREYLTYMLRSDGFVSMITGRVAGAKMPRVSMDDFRKFEVPIPPIELQNQFADFVTQVDKFKLKVQKSLDELQTLFDSLMQEYFG